MTLDGLKISVSEPRGSDRVLIFRDPWGEWEVLPWSCDLLRGSSQPVQDDATIDSPRNKLALQVQHGNNVKEFQADYRCWERCRCIICVQLLVALNVSRKSLLRFNIKLPSFNSHSPEKCKTRKSSCVNARGIPTAAYQVLHLFPEVGSEGGGWVPEVWYPPPPGQVWWGGGYPRYPVRVLRTRSVTTVAPYLWEPHHCMSCKNERIPFSFIETSQTASCVYNSMRHACFLLQCLLYLRIDLGEQIQFCWIPWSQKWHLMFLYYLWFIKKQEEKYKLWVILRLSWLLVAVCNVRECVTHLLYYTMVCSAPTTSSSILSISNEILKEMLSTKTELNFN